jgi:DNA repair photolyase
MSLLTPFDPWKNPLCTCPKKFSLSPYTGCGHGCLYCYASSYIRHFAAARPKKDFLARLKKEIVKIPSGSIIAMANSSDPYQPLEGKEGLTRKTLEILKNYDLKINIVTKSSLVLRDTDILKGVKKILISISFTTLDEKLAKKLEPGASSPAERIEAVKKLSLSMPVAARLDPLIYPLTTPRIKETIKKIKQAGAKQIITSTYKAKPDNLKRMLKFFPDYQTVWKKFYLEKGERKNGYIYLPPKIRKELIEKARNWALSQNLEFSSCREGLESLNTAACDGSSLFSIPISLKRGVFILP